MGNDELLLQFDADLLSLQLLCQVDLGEVLRCTGSLVIELIVHRFPYFDKRAIDEHLLEEVVLHLAAAHQESLQDQVEPLSAVWPVQIRLQRPVEGMSHHSCILESLLKQELCQRRVVE